MSRPSISQSDHEVKRADSWSENVPATHDDQLQALAEAYVPGSDAEKRLLKKIDMRIVVSTISDKATDQSHASGLFIPCPTLTAPISAMPKQVVSRRTSI